MRHARRGKALASHAGVFRGARLSSLLPVPLGSHVYAKPRPSQRGTPWIYGQVVDNPSPSSYSVDTGDLVLRRNRTQLQPAAPPQNNLQQPPALPIPQPSPLGTPTILSDLSQRKLSQPPCHSPSSGMSALSAPSQCRSNRCSKQMLLTTSSLSFFLVHRAKRPRHANDHAREGARRERHDPRFSRPRRSTRARARKRETARSLGARVG